MEKEIIVEPVELSELSEAERKAAEEAMKAFGKRVKEALRRAPVADEGIFAAWEAKKNGTYSNDETDDATEE